MVPEFPVYIPSKGRHDSRLTVRTLDELGVPYFVVIEEQEWKQYAAVIDKKRLLVLDPAYFDSFDPCDDLGRSKPLGVGPARNFILDHARSTNSGWHWQIDDNVRHFYRVNKNEKRRVSDGTIFKCMEDFVQRYDNVLEAGPNYMMFVKHRFRVPPFILNTRIYSIILLNNAVPFRWRARYNDDTDMSLRILKAGFCTILFNAFLAGKAATQTVKGGLTKDIYEREGTVPKSTMLYRLHPDVVRPIMRFGREHHWVSYKHFTHKLSKREGLTIKRGVDNYGMTLKKVADGVARV